jgi:hypothetical protein
MSNGEVFEVHWDGIGSMGDLYEEKDFFNYGWFSGMVVTPPDANFVARSIAEIRAAMNKAPIQPLPARQCRR